MKNVCNSDAKNGYNSERSRVKYFLRQTGAFYVLAVAKFWSIDFPGGKSFVEQEEELMEFMWWGGWMGEWPRHGPLIGAKTCTAARAGDTAWDTQVHSHTETAWEVKKTNNTHVRVRLAVT
jgi:hypothetical protein